MLNHVSVLIPFATDHGAREQNFNWIQKFYEKKMPEVEMCIGESRDQPFSRSQAINHAAAQATRDIFVIADSDVFYDPTILLQAIQLLDTHTWVLPFCTCLDIDQPSTEAILKMEPDWPITVNYHANVRGQIGYGLTNVIPRRHFEAVGGFDERFLGWGGEDDAFAVSVNHICGWLHRMEHTAYHLWHPPGDLTHYGENVKYLQAYFSGIESIKNEIENRKKRH